MTRRTATLLTTVLVGLLAAALTTAGPAATAREAVPPAPSRVVPACADGPATGRSEITTSDGHTHAYFWRVPATAAPATGRPVLLWLHGDGGTGKARAPGFWPYSDPDGAIIITPNGTHKTWTHAAGDIKGLPLDSQFLSKIIKKLGACEQVDTSRIFVGGTSRGAFMPYFLLMRKSTRDKIAAVAVNAGGLYCQNRDSQCVADTSDPVLHGSHARILHLHGTDDTSVPPPTATFHDPVDWDVDWKVFYPMNLWAQQHGCWDPTEVGGTNNGVLRETYDVDGHAANVYDLTGNGPECDGYELILVDDGGHVIDGQEGRIWAFLMDRPFVG